MFNNLRFLLLLTALLQSTLGYSAALASPTEDNGYTPEQALNKVVHLTGRKDIIVTYALRRLFGSDVESNVTFTIVGGTSGKQLFEFWNSKSKGFGDFDVIPADHPYLQYLQSPYDPDRTLMINGSSDYLIGGRGIVGNFYPPSSSIKDEKGTEPVRWHNVSHPYKVITDSITILIDLKKLSSNKNISHLATILNYALRMDGRYIEVSGGFSAAFKDIKLGTRSGEGPRGCEKKCVGLYKYLEERGELLGAYVPDWLIKDGWIKKEVEQETKKD